MSSILLLACVAGPEPVAGVDLSPVAPTVVEVRYSLPDFDAGEAWIEFGADGAFDRRAEFEEVDGQWRALLLGNKALTEVEFRLVRDPGDGDPLIGEARSIVTGPAPTWLSPPLVVDHGAGEAFDGRFLLTSNVTSPSAVVVLDADGDFVWWSEVELFGMIASARLARDGRSFLALPVNVDGAEEGRVLRLGLDGALMETIDLPGAHHDFVELADGTIGTLVHDVRQIDGVDVRGDALVERDPDGTLREIWSAFDTFDPAADDGAEEREDWSHGNSVSYVAEADAWLVTLLGLRSVLLIDRQGEVLWALGGPNSTFADVETGQPFELGRIHQASFASGGSLMVFENDSSGSEDETSRALELELDLLEGEASRTWTYSPEPSVSTYALGDLLELDDGARLVVFSSNGRIDQVAADGSLQWRLSTSLGQTFGFAELLDWP